MRKGKRKKETEEGELISSGGRKERERSKRNRKK